MHELMCQVANMLFRLFLFCNVVVRSTDSDTVFDEKYEAEQRPTKRWRKKRSLYQATTDSADSMSEPEVSCLRCTVVFLMMQLLSVFDVHPVCFGPIWLVLLNQFSAVLLCTASCTTAYWCIVHVHVSSHGCGMICQMT